MTPAASSRRDPLQTQINDALSGRALSNQDSQGKLSKRSTQIVGKVATHNKDDDEDDLMDAIESDGEESKVNPTERPESRALKEVAADKLNTREGKTSLIESSGDVPSEHMSTDGNQIEYRRDVTQRAVAETAIAENDQILEGGEEEEEDEKGAAEAAKGPEDRKEGVEAAASVDRIPTQGNDEAQEFHIQAPEDGESAYDEATQKRIKTMSKFLMPELSEVEKDRLRASSDIVIPVLVEKENKKGKEDAGEAKN